MGMRTEEKDLRLSDGFPTLLIFGGSQGAKRINEASLILLNYCFQNSCDPCLRKYNFAAAREVAGKRDSGNRKIQTVPFLYDEMKDAYAVSI